MRRRGLTVLPDPARRWPAVLRGPARRWRLPCRTVRLPRRTVRLRLAAIYGSLFLASGTALLGLTYALVQRRPAVTRFGLPGRAPAGALPQLAAERRLTAITQAVTAAQRADTLHQLVLASGAALAVMTVASAWLGWLVAGRVLRPLRLMTAKTRQISEVNLHERLALAGPADELKELGDTIDRLLARLDAAFSAQRQFVANASHELRTPLALARAMIEVALADPAASAASLRETCEQVLRAGEEQERLVEALLTLARSQRGIEQQEPFDLGEVTATVVAARATAARTGELRLDAALAGAAAAGDPRLAERLVVNLLDNALRHNLAGGWVRVVTCTRDGRAVLRVANSGPVIPAAQISRLLRPFERLGRGRTSGRAGGAGLGLPIVEAIASAHGAGLSIRARPGGGLDVEVVFPPPPGQRGSGSGSRGQPAPAVSRPGDA